MSDKVYCYPDSDVLINKLNIRESDRLHVFERRLTMLRLLELMDNPVEGTFDFKHLQDIHKYIFQDIYDWAGMVRTVDIAKGNMFCNVMFIESQANELFEKLKTDMSFTMIESLRRRWFRPAKSLFCVTMLTWKGCSENAFGRSNLHIGTI